MKNASHQLNIQIRSALPAVLAGISRETEVDVATLYDTLLVKLQNEKVKIGVVTTAKEMLKE